MQLWKNNKLDQEYQLPNTELVEQFIQSRFCQDDYLTYYGLKTAIISFIGDSEDGLSSSFACEDEQGNYYDNPELDEVYELAKATMKQKCIWFTVKETA